MQVGLHVSQRNRLCSYLHSPSPLNDKTKRSYNSRKQEQNDLITPENRMYDDGSAAASGIT